MKNSLNIWLTILISVFVGLVVGLSLKAVTSTENVLISVVLTLLSVVVTWVVGHFYAKQVREAEIDKINEAHEKNLKTYALNAAEKVTNISKEIGLLSGYLSQYLESEDDEDISVILGVRDELISGTIHMLNTLRSVNDTGLSDWKGVIGEELDQKREEEEEKEEEKEEDTKEYAKELLEKIEHLMGETAKQEKGDEINVKILRGEFRDEIYELRNEIAKILIGTSSRRPTSSYTTSSTRALSLRTLFCPACDAPVKVRVSRKGKAIIKGIDCRKCGTRLVSRPDDQGEPILDIRKEIAERVACLSCENDVEVMLDNVNGVHKVEVCGVCKTELRVIRTKSGVTVRLVNLESKFISAVRAALPPQPWPKGIHKEVAEELGTTGREVQKAIAILISDGIFQHQVNGVVVEDIQSAGTSSQLDSDTSGPPKP